MKRELDVVAALIKEGDTFLLCQRKKDDFYGGLWEFPGGAVEEDESLPQAVEREIEEELGLKIKAGELIGDFFDENEDLKIKVFLFRCSIRAGTPTCRDCQDFGFFTPAEMAPLSLAPVDGKNYRALFSA